MKKFIFISFLMICAGLFIINSQNYYTEEKNRKTVVLDKLTSLTHHKRSATENFLLILKLDDGRMIDLRVSPVTWSQSDVGDELYFNLSERQIQHNGTNTLILLVGWLLVVTPFAGAIVIGMFTALEIR